MLVFVFELALLVLVVLLPFAPLLLVVYPPSAAAEMHSSYTCYTRQSIFTSGVCGLSWGCGSSYSSVDPAPPAVAASVEELRSTLLDTTLSLFHRYRALFALRDNGADDAVLVRVLLASSDGKGGRLGDRTGCDEDVMGVGWALVRVWERVGYAQITAYP